MTYDYIMLVMMMIMVIYYNLLIYTVLKACMVYGYFIDSNTLSFLCYVGQREKISFRIFSSPSVVKGETPCILPPTELVAITTFPKILSLAITTASFPILLSPLKYGYLRTTSSGESSVVMEVL